ncbi:MAG: 3-methylcrotonyl-CoA carboxylase [Rhodospirillales bacterium 24-66-33]|jgi:3-methylcrotonyl-CoA carboxylase alpha subunit|uniref:acetyl/propionyl/methylcrotonyl-CoA carboxylase subunit alpha n=1 Tax=Reyranella sp. TaxID=1929291 RepID=UPI000BD57C5A|nr:acetyl/propionyl/methylcrotonyl-CoA carboxylase subunit alpha [Reyranella sp.]OYY40979.1 MAG: 3-methylcrotonyl-CoA carboxylase [Rhodospirillales bacterium 35-66-84]OYZ95949.1 MAG: 3-methylcrotonyl-CoA carboxylase [Rhodospirillales bacterium 24-66-33]OZB25830.1 MAG: 3-methylcrotonyl-CoA carboxylase [Rhodospirillales bacterium 39-66-50]HQS14759.1 acetyl/propionyl/methylcrotonyl-CoA carboxylase subunit alpha [Reyranella sp.]HQT14146.1 acetyl/propionyl/methylcrotonyl-CoA carboxylase subunit alp
MFSKILIANRGEIACRVIKTAKRLGIKTVAVYSDADRTARHVAMADEAVHIGPSAARESYLVADRIIDAAKRTGAQAIHPGYGFLSENAGFADACAAAGIVFIGPPAASIRAMGSKSEAKKIMEKARVPLVPGYHGDDQSPELLASEAAKIGFPVLIKASAGGGGKGMRVVESAGKFADALAGAKREAKASFADDHVLVEKYLTRPRHIEIQVFADGQGNCLYLFERDCSIQRRHQKVIEEAPAPNMDPARRKQMGEAAVAAAKAIGYQGAGTVEFIADQDGTFFFMEMNTRLQVEHPVTEAITGQDLVEWQLIVAAGGKMPLSQDELRIDGHAVEVRLYAEDPARNFLPSTGTLVHLKLPEEGAHVRVDTGVRQGDTVTPFYDPMIAKVIVHDRDRTSALRRMAALMGETEVVGVTTNSLLLKALCSHPAFVGGEVDTGFIERHRATLFAKPAPAGDRAFAVATLARLLEWQDAGQPAAGDPWSPWNQQNGFRLLDEGHEEVRWKDGEREVVVIARRLRGGGVRLELPEGALEARVERLEDGRLSIGLGQDSFVATVVRRTALDGGIDYTLFMGEGSNRLRLVDPLDVTQYEATASADAVVRAPLPGKIIDLRVKAGDTVSKGQALLVLEAMKMEHTLAAPADGTVKSLRYAVGEQVPEGAELVEFE